MWTRHGPLDIWAFIEKAQGFDQLLSNTVVIGFHSHKVHVLSLETILDLKRDSEDPKDRFRIPILEDTLRQIKEDKKK